MLKIDAMVILVLKHIMRNDQIKKNSLTNTLRNVISFTIIINNIVSFINPMNLKGTEQYLYFSYLKRKCTYVTKKSILLKNRKTELFS